MPKSRHTRTNRVLWIEDEPDSVQDCYLALERQGIGVDFAESGDAAHAALSERDYAAVILDLHYPNGQPTGEQIAREIGAVYPQLLIAIVTAHKGANEESLARLAVSSVENKADLYDKEYREAWALRIAELVQTGLEQERVRVLSYALMDGNAARFLFNRLSGEQTGKLWSLAETLQVAWRVLLTKDEDASIATAFLWGNLKALSEILPAPLHRFAPETRVASLLEARYLHLADGKDLAFGVNLNGEVEGVFSIKVTQEDDGDYVAPARCLNHCRCTGHSDVISVLACGTHRRISIFTQGQLFLECLSGEWRRRDLRAFQDRAIEAASQRCISEAVIKKVCRACWELSEERHGATFLVGPRKELLASCDQVRYNTPKLELTKSSIENVPLHALLALARCDGAVLVDSETRQIVRHGAFLCPESSTKLSMDHRTGSRHASAAMVTSEERSLMALVVSQNARVTLFCDGTEHRS